MADPERQAARIATARAILAMCCFQLNQNTEGLSQLRQCREMIERRFAANQDSADPSSGYWFDWVSARLLLREAAALAENGHFDAKATL